MKNKIKRILACGLAALSVTACALGASATSTVSVPSTDSHSYSVYQIMTGTSDGTALTNVKWGQNAAKSKTVGEAVSHEDLTAIEALASLSTDAEKLKGTTSTPGLATYVDLTSEPYTTVTSSASANVDDGYYLFKDKDTLSGSDTYSLYIAKVADGSAITISRKAAGRVIPNLTKQVMDGNTAKEAVDAAINEPVTFKLTATLPDNLDAYSAYKYVLTDTPSAGLTLDKTSVKVMAGSKDVTTSFTTALDGSKLVISCDNIKAISGVSASTQFVFTYTGKLNSSAAAGIAGNTNNAVLAFSNNPNDRDSTGTTGSLTDNAKVYTYRLVINEKDEDNKDLPGVGLTLYKKDGGSYVPVGTEVKGPASLVWNGLDAGEYKLVETTTPSGYKPMSDKEFTITSTISADGVLTALNSTLEGASTTLSTGTVEATFGHVTKATLPVTGAMGLVAIMGAAALAGGAAFVLRKKNEED